MSDLHEEPPSAELLLVSLIDTVMRIADQIPPPNPWTPQLMQAATSSRDALNRSLADQLRRFKAERAPLP